jgi:hypothetical protein
MVASLLAVAVVDSAFGFLTLVVLVHLGYGILESSMLVMRRVKVVLVEIGETVMVLPAPILELCLSSNALLGDAGS